MQVRPAGADDVDVVAQLRVAFLADHRGLRPDDLPAALVPRTRDYVGRLGASGQLRSWLADEDGTAVGVVSLLVIPMPPRPDDPRTTDGCVLNMYVRPPARQRGIGSALLDACLAGAADLSVRRVFLIATDDGLPLYERTGFTTNDRHLELRLPR